MSTTEIESPLNGTVDNVQSLNRYSYSVNNPGSMNDPLGVAGTTVNKDKYSPFLPKGVSHAYDGL
jgi:hypothetical protein